jgi:hypothetical protein
VYYDNGSREWERAKKGVEERHHYKVDALFLSWHTAYVRILQDPETMSGYAQHKIISEILHTISTRLVDKLARNTAW